MNRQRHSGVHFFYTALLSLFLFFTFYFLPSIFAEEAQPITVHAEQVEYFEGLRKVIASGHVEALYQDMKLTCDRAVIYMDTQDAYLEGEVALFQKEGLLRGQEVHYNFRTKKGTVLGSKGEFGPWRSSGDRARKISETSFLHQDGYLTACDFEAPHTRLQAKTIQVYLDDKVVLRHAVGYVGGVPLLYLPSYTHPLDDKRPRVTLVPGKEKEWGLFLLSAWRLYLHENLQGRFHVDWRERLDLATGVDLEYKLPVGGEGLFRQYYTLERALQREHVWSKFTRSDKDKASTERERYRFQVRHVWEVDKATRATLEYHQTSDKAVVKDFFFREFEDNTETPTTYFQVIRSHPWYGLTFLTKWRPNRFETVTQQLPQVAFDIRPIRIPFLPNLDPWTQKRMRQVEELIGEDREFQEKFAGTGWHYQSSSSYEHSNVDEPVHGTEDSLVTFNTVQQLFHPLRPFGWLNLRPFGKFQHTMFSRGAVENAPQFRQAAATGFDLSTKFFRIFPIDTRVMGIDIHRLRHVITPSVGYTYQAKPTLSAERLLRSDGLAKSNLLSFGKEHKLQTKREGGKGGETVDLARFITTIPYDLEGPSGVGGRWGNVAMDVELLPYSWLRFESDAQIDTRIGKFSTINSDLVLRPTLDDRYGGPSIGQIHDSVTGELTELPWAVGLGWRYQRNRSSQLTLETEFNLGPKWRIGILQGLDVKRFVEETSTQNIRTVKKVYDLPEFEYRIRRDLHEWTVELVYDVRRQQGEAVLLLFRLKALPELPFEFERNYHQPKSGRNFPKR